MFLDAHIHIGGVFSIFTTQFKKDYLLSLMDSMNISFAFVTSISSSLHHNLYLANEISKSKGRLFGFYWVNPKRSTILNEISNVLNYGFVGLKFRAETDNYSMFNISLIEPILDYASKMNLLVYIHCSNSGVSHPYFLRDLCSLYPELKIIAGHMAQGSIDLINIAMDFDNIFLETSVCYDVKIIEYALRKLGADRILFGSDYPYSNMYREIAKILSLKIPLEDKLKILRFNSLSLLPSKYPL
ncbi:MAG: amidohydrolase family protein [Candidatus Methanomethylicia archaeon]|nr:amidohydrolase family protein [Candidatus Methanomethylicia archaeon]